MIVEASLVGFIRTIVIILVSYYFIKFVVLRVLPLFLIWKRMKSSTTKNDQHKKSDKNKKDKDLGEYVDFEEVED